MNTHFLVSSRKSHVLCIVHISIKSKGAPSPDTSSIQFVTISWSGKSKFMLLELDPVSIRFILNWISFYLIQFRRVSLRPERVIPKAKAMFKNTLLLDKMQCFALLLNRIVNKISSRRVSLASKKSSKNCHELDLTKYLRPESLEFEFPALGDYDKLDR